MTDNSTSSELPDPVQRPEADNSTPRRGPVDKKKMVVFTGRDQSSGKSSGKSSPGKSFAPDTPGKSSRRDTPWYKMRMSSIYASGVSPSSRPTSLLAAEGERNVISKFGDYELADADERERKSKFAASADNRAVEAGYHGDGYDVSRAAEYGAEIFATPPVVDSEMRAATGLTKDVQFTYEQLEEFRTAVFQGKDIAKTYDFKPARQIFRWNLLWAVLCLLAPYPLWLTWFNCKLMWEITMIINIVLRVNFLYATVCVVMYLWSMLAALQHDWKRAAGSEGETLVHIVVMPCYKEPVELLIQSIQSLANQTIADQIVVCVGMEQKTPDVEAKQEAIQAAFDDGETCAFQGLIFSVHPFGQFGEIPGACSNRNYAARESVRRLIRNGTIPMDMATGEVDLSKVLLTVCDSDTMFHPKYFECLTDKFVKAPNRLEVCYQSPLFYNIDLNKRYFFTRCMGILRGYFMIGYLIGMHINTMSIYSMSLDLLVQSQFFHPGYQMDDIIYTLSAMRAIGKRVKIVTIDVPTLSGPTSGDSLLKEFDEFYVQAMRWTIGAAEVFHYFFIKLLGRKMDIFSGLAYFTTFTYYYGFVLCISGVAGLLAFIIGLISLGVPEYSPKQCKVFDGWGGISHEAIDYDWLIAFWWIFDYTFVFGVAFIMDAVVVQVLALDEKVDFFHNVFHFIMTQPTLWIYCIIEYIGIIKVALYGKKVCGHKPSDKAALAKPTPEPGMEKV